MFDASCRVGFKRDDARSAATFRSFDVCDWYQRFWAKLDYGVRSGAQFFVFAGRKQTENFGTGAHQHISKIKSKNERVLNGILPQREKGATVVLFWP